MSNLEKYIKQTKEYIQDNNLSEIEALRYIYLNLGQRLSFDTEFSFGNSKKKREIYDRSIGNENLEKNFSENTIICKSLAFILKKILNDVGINANLDIDIEDKRHCKHMCNIIRLKNGKTFLIDLQDDLENIQSHSRTQSFGLPLNRLKREIFSRFDLEQIDRKLGYITNENYYSDDYLYLLKHDIGFFEDFHEKAKFVLENLEIYDNPNIKYSERYWHHQTLLTNIFTCQELSKIKQINCYKDTDEGREYIHCIAISNKDSSDIYLFNKKENMYKKIEMEEFVKMENDGLTCLDTIQGLKQFKKKYQANMEENSDISVPIKTSSISPNTIINFTRCSAIKRQNMKDVKEEERE